MEEAKFVVEAAKLVIAANVVLLFRAEITIFD